MAVGGGVDEVFDGAVCVSCKHSEHPGLPQAGVFFYVGASYAYPGAPLACLAPGARRVGFDVCAGGVNGDLAARETEVRGL